MQTTTQLAPSKSDALLLASWFEPEHIFAQHLDATIGLLSQMSQYPFAAYCYDVDGKQYLKTNITEQSRVLEVTSDTISQLQPCRSISLDTSNFLELKLYLSQLCFKSVQSLSVLKLSGESLGQPVTILLFSEHKKIISPSTWACLDQYLQQRADYLKQLVENHKIQQQVLDLQDINNSRSKYFSVIAHDLRAPFHGILGCADILVHERDTLDDDAAQRLVSYVHDTAQSTYGLLENLLNWAMAEGGRFHFKPTHFNVSDIVQSIFELLCAFAFKKQIKLQCDVASNLYAYADVRMVTSILQNLTSNALKFTAANSQKKIHICARKNHQWIEITVQDEGIGMTPAQIQKLFQQQHTIPSTQGTAGEKGTGLGLVLCKHFLEMNHGTIAVESRQDHGTRFIVRLPMGDRTA